MNLRTATFALPCLALLVGAGSARAEGWELVAEKPFVIKTRQKPGAEVNEVWAEGVIEAPAWAIQQTLLAHERQPAFMPYVKECRTLGTPGKDGAQYVYTRLDLPTPVSSRDYVVKVSVESRIAEDGTGEFKNHWKAVPDRIPERRRVVRVRINEGSWKITPRGPNRSYAVYRFVVDPGGWIPSFAASLGNKDAVIDTVRGVQAEAQRLARERATAHR